MASRLHAHIGTFRQLEILLAVHDCGSITAAAERLYLSQPTLSMQLKKLAEAVGLPLYETRSRRIHFTEAGMVMVGTAREVFERIEALDMQLSDLRGLRAGTLRVAVVSTAKYFMPHLLAPFCEQYPGIDVELTVANRRDVLRRLADNRDEIYFFSHPPEDMDIVADEFIPNPLVAIAPVGHPLAADKDIALTELLRYPFLMREPGSGTRYAIERFMQRQGLALNVRMTIESNEAIKHAVMAGMGISILSEHTLAFGGDEGLCRLSVKGLPINVNWYLVRQGGRQLSLIARSFVDYISSEGRGRLLQELSA